jgi:hypothetical protein
MQPIRAYEIAYRGPKAQDQNANDRLGEAGSEPARQRDVRWGAWAPQRPRHQTWFAGKEDGMRSA